MWTNDGINLLFNILLGIILLPTLLSSWANAMLKFPGRPTIPVYHEPRPLVGITFIELQAPLFYDTFFTVLYELDIPPWNVSNVKLEIPKNLSDAFSGRLDRTQNICDGSVASAAAAYYSNNSSSSNGTVNPDLWEATLCPIKLMFDELLQTFAHEMKTFETFNASIAKMDSKFSSCNEIKPHFTNHIIDEVEVELYLVQLLLSCPISDVIHHKLNVNLPDKGKYSGILKTFLETYIIPRFRLIGFPRFAIPTNTLLTLQNTHLLHYLLDMFQWTTAINTCNSQRLPRVLISQQTLTEALNEVEGRIEKEGLKLTIPISDLSNYYKLQLADCVTTNTNKYIVRILIPLVKASANYKQVSIRSIPFLNQDTISSKTMICHHKLMEGNYIVDGTGISMRPVATLTSSLELESELRMVPREGDRILYSKCLYSVLENNLGKMQQHCRMTCIPYDSTNLPFIKRIRSDQFVIAGTSSAEIAIICRNGKKEEDKPIPVEGIPKDLGSLIVTLPCGCYMTHRSVKYEIDGNCEFTLDFLPIRPKGFSYDALLEHYFHHHLQNISNTIASSLINKTQLLFADDAGDRSNSEAEVKLAGAPLVSQYPNWPICIVYTCLFIGTAFLVCGFYVLRNVYVRIGQLEMTSMSGARPSGRYHEGSNFSRNAQVAFNVRGSGNFGSQHHEAVF